MLHALKCFVTAYHTTERQMSATLKPWMYNLFNHHHVVTLLTCRRERALQRLAIVDFVSPKYTQSRISPDILVFFNFLWSIISYRCDISRKAATARLSRSDI